MNLGTKPFLDDVNIEIDILIAPGATAPVLDNFHLYLRLAQIQGEMDKIWHMYQEVRVLESPLM